MHFLPQKTLKSGKFLCGLLWVDYDFIIFYGMKKSHVEVYRADFVTMVFTEYICFILCISMNNA